MASVFNRLVYQGQTFLIDTLLPRNLTGQYSDAASQLQLRLTYQALAEGEGALPDLTEVGFKAFSQADEDGILLYIFSIIGNLNKKSVEIGVGNGIECNTANLIIYHGWNGLLVDANKALVKQGKKFYGRNPHTYVYPPVFVHSWITRDNVNDVISDNGFAGDIDLLSIDIDGVDYWIWEAINVIDPRVVVVEYQNIIPADRALTVPYEDSFDAYKYPTTNGLPNFCGASLLAFAKLAKSRGYRLVGCNRYGYNAFFIKDPLGKIQIPEIDISECLKHPNVAGAMKERFPTVKDLPWVDV